MKNNNISNITEKENKNKNTKKAKEKIGGSILLAWFFASLVALMYFSKINQLFSVAIFGQYFLVFGLLGFNASKNEKGFDKYFPLIFALVGLICIIVPLLMANPKLISIEINWDVMIPLLMLFGFFLTGLGLIFIPIMIRKYKLKRCNYTVISRIKTHKTTIDDSNTLYCPVYEFSYNSRTYEVDGECYSNIGVKPVGTEEVLLINPKDPNEYVFKNKKINMFVFFFGILFLLSSVFVTILILTGNSNLT